MMIKKLKENLAQVLLIGGLCAAMCIFLAAMPTDVSVSAADSVSGNSYEPNVVEVSIPDAPDPEPPSPYESSIREQEAMVEEIVTEGRKVENQTVAGEKSGANGLYLANKVRGVAVNPSTENNGAALYIETLDTDQKKSSAAMASIESEVESFASIFEYSTVDVGPVIDVYFKKTENGRIVDGTAKDVDYIKIGIPTSFQEDGYNYGYVVALPGGKTFWGATGVGAEYVNVDMVRGTWDDTVDYSQATIALVKGKRP